jgi:chromosome segregation ATPase
MDNGLLVAIVAACSSFVTMIVPKLFNKKIDAVAMYAELQANLFSEIARLELKIRELENREEESYILEEKLTKRIMELEQENKRQSYEIEQLKAELAKHVKNN